MFAVVFLLREKSSYLKWTMLAVIIQIIFELCYNKIMVFYLYRSEQAKDAVGSVQGEGLPHHSLNDKQFLGECRQNRKNPIMGGLFEKWQKRKF